MALTDTEIRRSDYAIESGGAKILHFSFTSAALASY